MGLPIFIESLIVLIAIVICKYERGSRNSFLTSFYILLLVVGKYIFWYQKEM